MKIDLASSAHAADPLPIFNALRAQGDVVQIKLPIIGKVWLTISYEATAAMLKASDRFSMRDPSKGEQVAGMTWWMPTTIRLLANNMLTSDEPDHRRLRKLVDQAFQRRAINQLETRVTVLAHELIDAFPKNQPVDLVENYARKLPLMVICELLGLGEAETQSFAQEAAKMTSVTGIWSFIRALRPLWKIRRQLQRIVGEEKLRQQQGEFRKGLITELVRTEMDGDRLSEEELIAMIFLLLIAGHETTTHMISGSVLTLFENPDQRVVLSAQPERIDLAVEELLRYVSAVQMSKPRIVGWAGDFHGVHLKKGDKVMACLGAANRDPVHYTNPDKLILDRKPNPHLEFGTGIHFCLGLQLARLELRVALQVLLERLPGMQLAEPEPEWNNRMGLRSLKHLHIVGA